MSRNATFMDVVWVYSIPTGFWPLVLDHCPRATLFTVSAHQVFSHPVLIFPILTSHSYKITTTKMFLLCEQITVIITQFNLSYEYISYYYRHTPFIEHAFNVILPYLNLQTGPIFWGYQLHISQLSHSCSMTCPIHNPWFVHSSSIWCRIQITSFSTHSTTQNTVTSCLKIILFNTLFS
jgi:hypothetical protein